MKRLSLGIAIAAVVLYLWGFVYWGMLPYGTHIWKSAANDETVGAMLHEQFPERGTYYVPSVTHDQETVERLFERGPLAFVHILSTNGRPVFHPPIMIKGFALNFAFILLVATAMRMVAPALPTIRSRIRFSALLGIACGLLIDLGDTVWWELDIPWQIFRATYHATAWIIVGAVLAPFVSPATAEANA